jgi:hypothetical protein
LIRRNFLVNLLLGILAFLFGYAIKREGEDLNLLNKNTKMDLDKVGNIVSENDIVTLNIKSLGAKGDGVFDNTQIIQNAINSLNNDDTLFIPNGTYRLTGPLTISKKIRVKGNGNSILSFFNLNKAIILGDQVTQTYGGIFENIKIQGNTCNYGIYAKLRADILCKELTLEGFSTMGIYLERSWISKFENCYFRNNGIAMKWFDNSNASRVTNCTFIYNTVDIQVLGAYGLFVKQNSFEQSEKGVEILPGNLGTLNITDNYFEDNAQGGVYLCSAGITVDGYARNLNIARNHFTCIGHPNAIVIDGLNGDGSSNSFFKVHGNIKENTIFTDDTKVGFLAAIKLRGWSVSMKCEDNFAVEMNTGIDKTIYDAVDSASIIKKKNFTTEEFVNGFIEMTDPDNTGIIIRDAGGARYKIYVLGDGTLNTTKL